MQVTAANVQNLCHLLPYQPGGVIAPIIWESPSSTHDLLPTPGIINQVWHKNLFYEFQSIHNLFRHRRCFLASIDTEFPGTVFASDKDRLHDEKYNYDMMKANVDATNIIQLGLTLMDNDGYCYTWEFNFSDFDIHSDPHQNKSSIEFLKDQGIDFRRNKEDGISSREFATMCHNFGLVQNNHLTWVGFQTSYDFGFFIKILTHKDKLPNDIHGFMAAVKEIFGPSVFDIKHIIMRLSPVINGGLDKVAESLQVARAVGKSHTAGSDSLLTLLTFVKLMDDERFLVHGSNSSIVTLQKFTKLILQQHCTCPVVTNHVQLHVNVPCPDPDTLLRLVQFVDVMIIMRTTAGEEMGEIENYCRLYKCQGALYSLTSSSFPCRQPHALLVRPDHETVDATNSAKNLEELVLSPRTADVDRLQWAHLKTVKDKRDFKTVLQLAAYEKLQHLLTRTVSPRGLSSDWSSSSRSREIDPVH